MTRMFDATSPSEAFAPTPALPRSAGEGEGSARLSCSLSRLRRGRAGVGATRPRLRPPRRRHPRRPPLPEDPPARLLPAPRMRRSRRRRPGQCRRRPGRRRHRRDRDRDRRGCCGHGHQPGSREGLPLHLRRLPHEHPPARRSRRLARMVPAGDHPVRPLPPAARPAPGPSLWRAGDARRMRGARPTGLGRAREPGPAARPDRRLPRAAARLDRSLPPGGQLRRPAGRGRRARRCAWRWQPSSMPRPMPRR